MKSRHGRKLSIGLGLLATQFGPATAADGSAETVQLAPVLVSDSAPEEGSAEQGYRMRRVQLGPLGDDDAQKIPYSLFAVSSELMANTQAGNVGDALKYVPTVLVNTGASQITPYFTLRGFTASQTSLPNAAVDGMRAFDIYQPLEDKASIQVMPGASGFLYGINSPAGIINYVTKRPSATPTRELSVGSYDRQLSLQAGLGGPVDAAGRLAYRIDAGLADAGDTGVDDQSQGRQVLAGSLAWQLTPDTRLDLGATHAKRNLDYAQALFMTSAAIGIPAAPDASKNYGAPYTFAHDQSSRLDAALETRLNEVFRLRAHLRSSDIRRAYRLNRQVWQNADLDYKWRLDSQDPFHIRVNQYALFLDADFATGPLRHRLSLGATLDDYDKDYDGARSQTFASVYPGNLYGSPGYPALELPKAGTATAQQTEYTTLLLADRIAIGERWELLLGANRAQVDDQVDSRNPSTGVVTTTRYDSGKTTPAVSVSFTPIPAVTAYAGYSEALQQGFVSTASGNRGQVFAPYVGRQQEVGAKTRFGALGLDAALFRIQQANQYTDTATQVASQDGRAIHEGWEISVTGRVGDHLTLVGGLTGLDARIDKAAANVGNTPQGVAEKMARLYAEYDLVTIPGLTVTGGASYTGRTPWDAANTLYVDAVTVFDAGLRYRTRIAGRDTTLRATVANLTGKDYWTTRSGILYLGNPRTLSLAASFAF